MQKADSVDRASTCPSSKDQLQGRDGTIEFDEKGDRKNAEITIFTMKGGKLEPIAVCRAARASPSPTS